MNISQQLDEYTTHINQQQEKTKANGNTTVQTQPTMDTQPQIAARWANYAKGPHYTNRWTQRTGTPTKSRFLSSVPDQPGTTLEGSEGIKSNKPPPQTTNYCPPDTQPEVVQQPTSQIPHTVHLPLQPGHSPMDTTSLPPVNHDAAIKRAKIQYTGLGDLFVFYNQLLNGMEQFGIYLSSLDTLRYQESVCPAFHNNQAITPARYKVMASTLYQKLQNPEVIPLEHTQMRNIINHYAEQNDGYKVLYAMLELVHPVLHQDAVLLPPKSTECNEDIHLYAQKFDSWLKYEAYANRPYSARETVNLFLRELSPHFALAISRIRRLMDTWNQYDPHVPEPLKITSLPATIERFLNEETSSTPWVRRLHHHSSATSPKKGQRHQPTSDDKTTRSKDKDTRSAKDKICRLCGGYGHDDPNCDFMARWMNASDAAKSVDARTRERLKDAYKQEQQRRRNRKLSKKVRVIRQMIDDGVHLDDVDEALAALPHILDTQEDLSDTDSETPAPAPGHDSE